MNIRRQYSLPNCTLVIDGLSDGNSSTNPRPTLSIIVSAKCQFVDMDQTLEGGRTFLENLAQGVSRYAQECLSGVHHPPLHARDGEYVELMALPDPAHHQLTWYPAPELHQSPVALTLSTVQMFDLVEAVDQFMADSQTLPDFSLTLEPVSRRFRQPDEPLAQRTIPAILGVASLAIAASLLFFLPIPEVKEPDTESPTPTQVDPNPAPTNAPSP